MKLAAAPPWPDTSETQRETSSVDNYFDKHRGVRPARFEGFDPVDVPVGNLQQFRVKGGRWYLVFRAHFRAPHLPFGERTFALSAGAIQLIVSNQIAF